MYTSQQIPDVQFHLTNTWKTNMFWTNAMCVNSQNRLCVQGYTGDKGYYIRWFDRNNGSLIKEIKCRCKHDNTGCICEHPVDPDVTIETCHECSKIRSYNMNKGESADIYTRAAVSVICTAPAGFILGAGRKGRIMQFRWKDGSEELELVHSVETNITDVQYMCYVEHNDAVVLSGCHPYRVCTVKLSDGSTLWELNQEINGQDIEPRGLCHDTDGRIYVALQNAGVMSLDSRTGELLQHLIKDVDWCYDVCWTSSQPQINLLHKYGHKISTFNISER